MRLRWWRRDRVRTCLRCGEQWRVPHALARRRRASKWSVGVSAADHLGSPVGGEGVAASYNLENAKLRAGAAARDMALRDSFRMCPKCGSTAWTERPASQPDARPTRAG
jgi:ribosomal protein S27AE